MAGIPEPTVSRRRLLAGTGTALAGGAGLVVATSDPATATVTMGTLTIDGDESTVSSPPERIDVTADGEFQASIGQTPERVDNTLQIHVDGVADDLDTSTAFGKGSGAFSLSANLYDHRDVTQGSLTPETAGESRSTDILVRVICSVVVDGSLVAEEFVETTATLTISREGMEVSVGGSGSIQVVTPA